MTGFPHAACPHCSRPLVCYGTCERCGLPAWVHAGSVQGAEAYDCKASRCVAGGHVIMTGSSRQPEEIAR